MLEFIVWFLTQKFFFILSSQSASVFANRGFPCGHQGWFLFITQYRALLKKKFTNYLIVYLKGLPLSNSPNVLYERKIW